MASKGNTKNAAVEFMNTGNAPEIVEEEQESNLDSQLGELAEEQAAAEVAEEVETPVEEQEEKPVTEEKPAEGTEENKEEEAEVDGNVAEVDPNALAEEVEKLPRVQELLKTEEALNVLKDALIEGYAIDTTDFPKAVEQLRLERSDAHLLYQIIDGAIPAATFLQNLEKGFDQKKVVEPIYLSMADHLGRNGFLEAYLDSKGFSLVPKDKTQQGQVASLADAVNAGAKINPEMKPLLDKISALEARLTPQQDPQVAAQNQQHETAFENEVKRLMTEKNVPADFFNDYKAALVEMITRYPGGKKAILDRIVKGNFVDVKRFFTTHNNAQLERAQKYVKPQTAAAPKQVVTKKTGSAGQKPGPTPIRKPTKPLTEAERKKRALDAFNGK